MTFRESKLTRILRGALTGKSRTSVICNISQRPDFWPESLSTLRFAESAGSVKIKLLRPVVQTQIIDQQQMDLQKNLEQKASEIETLRYEKRSLERKIEAFRATIEMKNEDAESFKKTAKESEENILELQKQYHDLGKEFTNLTSKYKSAVLQIQKFQRQLDAKMKPSSKTF